MIKRFSARAMQKVKNDLYTTPVQGVVSNVKPGKPREVTTTYNLNLPLNQAIFLIPANLKRWRLELNNLSVANIYYDFGRLADRETSLVLLAGETRIMEYPPLKAISFLDGDIGLAQLIKVFEATR